MEKISKTKRTAASSGLNAPLAMLCLPCFNLPLEVCDRVVPSVATSKASHSSSVGECPSSSEKNLCRSTILMRSKPWVVYQPSRSCAKQISDTMNLGYDCVDQLALHVSRSSEVSSIMFFSIGSVISQSWNAAVSFVIVCPSNICDALRSFYDFSIRLA